MKKKSFSSQITEGRLCIGCGMCESVFPGKAVVELGKDGKYCFKCTDNNDEIDEGIKKICPVYNKDYSDRIWGEYTNAYFGYSNNATIRYHASSGGMITHTLSYLLKTNKVNAVIQVGVDASEALTNCSYTVVEPTRVFENCGSRYAPAKLLSGFVEAIRKYDHIAIVGKPCDIRAVNNYLTVHPEYKEKVYLTLSFFCGGIPSQNATHRVLEKLGVTPDEISSFRYRGNGWPGFTTAELKDNTTKSMTYNEAWGQILGRDIHKLCKFCPDGLGECADISCGDAWYSTENGYPNFTEGDGRNIVLCRTDKGRLILSEMSEANELSIEEIKDSEDYLKQIQIGQYFRKTSLFGKVVAMRMMKEIIITPSIKMLWKWKGDRNILKQLKVMLGTIKRCRSGRI